MENTEKNRRFLAQKTIEGLSLQDIFDLLSAEIQDRFKRDPNAFFDCVQTLEAYRYTDDEIDAYMQKTTPVVVLASECSQCGERYPAGDMIHDEDGHPVCPDCTAYADAYAESSDQ